MKPHMEILSLREEIRILDAKWDAVVVEGEHGDSIDHGRELEVVGEMRALAGERLAELGVDLYRWTQEKLALADALAAEAKKFLDAEKAARSAAHHGTDALRESMLEQGMTVIEGEFITLRIQNGPPAVVVEEGFDIGLLPDEYLRYKAPELDRTALKTALKSGAEIPGITLESKPQLRARVRS